MNAPNTFMGLPTSTFDERLFVLELGILSFVGVVLILFFLIVVFR